MYILRITRFFARYSPARATYIITVYLDRLLRHGQHITLTIDSYIMHHLLITAVLAAAVKFMDDM
jgi:hypothetical protein